MQRTVFIHTNNKQLLGAKLAAFSLRKHLPKDTSVEIRILNVDELDIFRDFHGHTYLRNGKELTFDLGDLQSFTLARFMVPELMQYGGRAIVIDPDIFSFCPISELFAFDLKDAPLGSTRHGTYWHSSVMLLDCAKLVRWKMTDILKSLASHEASYDEWMQLKLEPHIAELPTCWNDIDHLDSETKLLHTSTRITQPWKTGLAIDFTVSPMPKIFGIVPREPLHKLLGKYPTHYQENTDAGIRNFFFRLAKEALDADVISMDDMREEIKNGHIRPDFMSAMQQETSLMTP